MQIPFFTLARQFERYRDDFLRIAAQTWSTGRVLQGPEVASLEARLQELTDRRHAVAVGSCTDALAFGLLSCGVGPGDEVLITALSFFASVSPILRVGAVPRFVDVDPRTFMMDVDALEGAITTRTRAIVAVHMFGQTAPMGRLESIARSHRLALIEDAAQAIGSRDADRPAGSMGTVSCLSFDPMKVIGAFGSGGAILTDDDGIASHVRQLRYHGREPQSRRYERLGYNSQLPSAQAAMLHFKLGVMDEWQRQRDALAHLYFDALGEVEQIQLPQVRTGSTHNWHKFVIRAADRDSLRQSLTDAGIGTMIHYPRVLSDEPAIGALRASVPDVGTEPVPLARAATHEVLTLPLFPELRPEEAQRVIEAIKHHYSGAIRG